MTQNAFLSSKVKLHFFSAGQLGSFSISILSKNVYTVSILSSDHYWHHLKFWKGSLCWVFSQKELRTWRNFKRIHKSLVDGMKWDDTVNKTTKKSSVCSKLDCICFKVFSYVVWKHSLHRYRTNLPPSTRFFSFSHHFSKGTSTVCVHLYCTYLKQKLKK